MKLRIDSKCLIWDANVPTVLGLASALMLSAFSKKTLESSISIALLALSTICARTTFMQNSKRIANKTPKVSTHSVLKPLVGTTLSYTCIVYRADIKPRELITNVAKTASRNTRFLFFTAYINQSLAVKFCALLSLLTSSS